MVAIQAFRLVVGHGGHTPRSRPIAGAASRRRSARRSWEAAHLLRLVGRCRQDLRDARCRKAPEGERAGRGRRCRRDARARRDCLAAAGARRAAAGTAHLAWPYAARIRSRRSACAQARADPCRRARTQQRRGVAPPEALAGCRRTARCRHRCLHHAQRTAPRKPERRGRRHHRHPRSRDAARHFFRLGFRSRARRYAGRRADRAAQGRQGLFARTGGARGTQLLSQRQPDGVARTRVASHCRPRRGRRAGLPGQRSDFAGLEDRGRVALLDRPARRRRPCRAQRRAPLAAARRGLARGLCRNAGAAAALEYAARAHSSNGQAGRGARRDHGGAFGAGRAGRARGARTASQPFEGGDGPQRAARALAVLAARGARSPTRAVGARVRSDRGGRKPEERGRRIEGRRPCRCFGPRNQPE